MSFITLDPHNVVRSLAFAGKNYFDSLPDDVKRRVSSRELLIRFKMDDNDDIIADTCSAVPSRLKDPWIGLLVDVDGKKTVYGLKIGKDDVDLWIPK